jgi:RNA recognition motif-containing protein
MKRVFVGNIPYDYGEDTLLETLEMVGPIKQFTIKYDNNTNKPKGFGFCDYVDEESASSALRNMNTIDYNGRQLRVNPANEDKNNAGENIDITTIKESESETKVVDVFKNLTDEQKLLMFHTLRVFNDNDQDNFRRLLFNQNEEFLEAMLTSQNDFLNKISNKSKNQVNKIIN